MAPECSRGLPGRPHPPSDDEEAVRGHEAARRSHLRRISGQAEDLRRGADPVRPVRHAGNAPGQSSFGPSRTGDDVMKLFAPVIYECS